MTKKQNISEYYWDKKFYFSKYFIVLSKGMDNTYIYFL